MGVAKTPAIPAAAPVASRMRRSAADTGSSWPRSEPVQPPVTMIGPSAPKGPPVPMATAAETGLARRTRGRMRLSRSTIASSDSGMPWPLMTGDHRASSATTSAPPTATPIREGPGW